MVPKGGPVMPNTTRRTLIDRPRSSVLFALSLALAVTACGDDGSAQEDDGSSSSGSESSGSSSPTASDPTVVDTSGGPTTATSTDDGSSTAGESTTGAGATLLERVVAGLGGEAALLGLEAVELEVSGSRWASDEGVTPRESTVPASDYAATISIDVGAASMRLDQQRTLTFAGLGLPLSYAEIVAGQLGYVDGVDNLFGAPSAAMPSDRVASTVRQQQLFNPQLLVRAAIDDPSIATELGAQEYDGRPHELLQLEGTVRPIVLWVDSETDQVSRLTTVENNPLRRDVELEVVFDGWAASDGGVWFPNALTLSIDGNVIAEEARAAVTTDVALDPALFELPDPGEYVAADAARGERNHGFLQEFISIGIPLTGEQTFVAPVELAPGIWHLTGGSHHSMLIEQSDGLVLFETPLAESRCDALLDWIDDTLPGATVTHAVVSHYHIDHAACARTLVARGATLVVGEGSESLWTEVLAAPSTVEPDALELDPVADPPIEFVPDDGAFTIDDDVRPVTVYDLPNPHSTDLVLPYAGGFGFVADLFSPGQPVQLFGPVGAQVVLDALELHGILGEVTAIVGAHGSGTATVAEVQAVAQG